MFQTKVLEKIKTYILRAVTFFPKTMPFTRNVHKYGRAREAADDNMAARCMLDTENHTRASTHTHRHTHAYTHTCLVIKHEEHINKLCVQNSKL